MKKLIQIILAFIVFVGCSPQSENTVNYGTTEFDVDGLKVIHKRVPKEIVSVRFFINGGTANYSLEQQGIENFAFNLAVTGGTDSLDKIAFSSELEKMGTEINTDSDYDYGQFELRCVKQYWNESWTLFADAILNPAFDEEQYGILKDQLLSSIKEEESNPDSKLSRLAMQNLFEGKNYDKNPIGTEESLNGILLDDIRNYYESLIVKKNSFMVVVGDIEVEDIKAKVKSTLAGISEGQAPNISPQTTWTEPNHLIEGRDIATNYIRGNMNAPKRASADGVPMLVAMSILRDRLFVEIRTKRSLSYAPYAGYPSSIVYSPYSMLYVSTTDPKQSIEVLVAEINKLRSEGFLESELADKKQTFLTRYYMDQETMSSQSSALGLDELRGGWEQSEAFTQLVTDVTLEDLNRVVKTYTDVINWTYLGIEGQVSEEDLLQPEPIEDSM